MENQPTATAEQEAPQVPQVAAPPAQEAQKASRPDWFPQVDLQPDGNFVFKSSAQAYFDRLTPTEQKTVQTDETGDGFKAVLKRDQDQWSFLESTVKAGKEPTDAFRNFDFWQYAKDRKLLGDEKGPGAWDLFTGLASSVGRGAAVVAREVDVNAITAGNLLLTAWNPANWTAPDKDKKLNDAEELMTENFKSSQAVAASTLLDLQENATSLLHGVRKLGKGMDTWVAEKVGAISPAQAKLISDLAEHEAFVRNMEAADHQALAVKALADYSGLTEGEVKDAGIFLSLFVDPMNKLPVEHAFKAAAQGLRGAAKGIESFAPGATEALRMELAKASRELASAKAMRDAAKTAIDEGAEVSHGAEYLTRLEGQAAEAQSRFDQLKGLHAESAASDLAAVEGAAQRSLARRAAGSVISATGKAVEAVGTGLEKVDAAIDRGTAAVVGNSPEVKAAVRGAVFGSGGAYVADKLEIGGPTTGFVLGALAGSKAGPKVFSSSGKAIQSVGDLIRIGETTQPFFRNLAQEIRNAPLPKTLADVMDPNLGSPFFRNVKRVAQATGGLVSDVTKGAIKGAAGAAPVGAAFGYVASGGDADEAINAGISVSGLGFVAGPLGTFTPQFRAGEHLKRLESNRQALMRRWGMDKDIGAGNLARFNELDVTQQLIAAQYLHANPNVTLLLPNKPSDANFIAAATGKPDGQASRVSGLHFEHQGQNYVVVNPERPNGVFHAAIAHELRHAITNTPEKRDALVRFYLGDATLGVPGYFTRYDENNKPVTRTDESGKLVYETNDAFAAARENYVRRVNESIGSNEYQIDDANLALEYDAEATAHHWIGGGFEENLRPTFSGLLHSYIEDTKFMRRLLGNLGVSFDRDFNVAGHGSVVGQIKYTPELRKLVDAYSAEWARAGELKPQDKAPAITVGKSPKLNDLLKTSVDVNRNPDGTIAGTEVRGGETILVDPSKAMRSKAQIRKDLDEKYEAAAQAVKSTAADDASDPNVVRFHNNVDGYEVLAGRQFSDRQIASLKASGKFNPYQLEQIRNFNEVMKANQGDFVRMFYQVPGYNRNIESTAGHWREEVPYGWLVTKKDNIVVRTVSFDKLVNNVQRLWKQEGRAKELWANPTNMTADAWDYINQLARMEDTTPTDKRNYLNLALGLGGKDRGDVNPLYSPTINRKLESIITSRRVDRINVSEPGRRSEKLPWSYEAYRRGVENLRPDDLLADEKGEPMTVYHGTHSTFDQFEPGRAGGIYFSPNKEHAGAYGPIVKEANLKIKKLADLTDVNSEAYKLALKTFNERGGWGNNEEAMEGRSSPNFDPSRDLSWEMLDNPDTGIEDALFDAGYDGVKLDEYDGEKSYVVFDPEQVLPAKSGSRLRPDDTDQKFGSEKTSLRQVPALFKKDVFQPKGTNLDIGAGAYNEGKDYLEKKRGVTESVPLDPFQDNRVETNLEALKRLKDGERFGTVTVPNVLNVIKEPAARTNVIRQAAFALEDGGKAYFQIHEGNRSGEGSETSKGWQNHLRTKDYVAEVEKVFRNVERNGNVIVASDPRPTSLKPSWLVTGEGPSVQLRPGDMGFTSQLEDTLAKIPLKASRSQIEAALRDGVKEKGQLIARPVKKEEMADVKDVNGVTFDEFLKQNPDATLEQMKDFARENRVKFNKTTNEERQGFVVKVDGEVVHRAEPFESERDAQRYISGALDWFRSEFTVDNDGLTDPSGEQIYSIENVDGQFVVNNSRGQEETRYDTLSGAKGWLRDEVERQVRYEEDRYSVEDHADSNETRYSGYKLPGWNENYKEHILTLPEKEGSTGKIWFPDADSVDNFLTDLSMSGLERADYGRIDTADVVEFTNLSSNQLQKFRDNAESYGGKLTLEKEGSANTYTSSHFHDVPGYLAHVRTTERETVDGKKVYFGEEIQSDLHQEGRAAGYVSREAVAERRNLVSEYDRLKAEETKIIDDVRMGRIEGRQIVEASKRVQEIQERMVQIHPRMEELRPQTENKLPDAPFKKSWHELGFKYLLNEAVRSGADYLGWTTGDQQNARYPGLEKTVRRVEWNPVFEETKGVTITPINGNVIEFGVKPDGQVVSFSGQSSGTGFDGKSISAVLGKELGNRILNERNGFAQGDGLKIGGDGMRAFYDRMIPQFAEKYLKKYGVKPEDISLQQMASEFMSGQEAMTAIGIPDREQNAYWARLDSDGRDALFKKAAEINKQVNGTVHAIRITPEMRQDILANGQPMYRPDEGSVEQPKVRLKGASRAPFKSNGVSYQNIAVNKTDDSLTKVVLENEPKKLFDRLDAATAKIANDPMRLADERGYVEYFRDAGVWGDVLTAPPMLKVMLERPKEYVDLITGGYHGKLTKPGTMDAADAGLDATVEMRSAINGRPPEMITAMHHLWGILSRMLPPVEQESAWLRLISQRGILEQMQNSIDGTFSLTQAEWKAKVSEAMAVSDEYSGGRGNQGTANANAFYLMLANWSGMWSRVSDVYTADNSIASGRRFWELGAGPAGIKNKVQRFIGLTFGIPGLIMDRWKFVEFYHQQFGKSPQDYFKYSAFGTPDDPNGIYGVYGPIDGGNSTFSLAYYEGLETALTKAIANSKDLQGVLGRHANLGGLHWKGWNAIKNEAVGHSSLDLTYDLALKSKTPTIDDVIDQVSRKEYYTEGLAGNRIVRFTLKKP